MPYLGPDQLIPLASIMGLITGALAMFWRQVVMFTRRTFKALKTIVLRRA